MTFRSQTPAGSTPTVESSSERVHSHRPSQGTFLRQHDPALLRRSSRSARLQHEENAFFDYNRESLMPHLLSTEGPALAVGDVNGDWLDDIYVGGAKWQAGKLFVQQRDGAFRASAQPSIAADSSAEDVDAVFFDANGDGHQDLFVVRGQRESGATRTMRSPSYPTKGVHLTARPRCAILRERTSGLLVMSTPTGEDMLEVAEWCRGAMG